MLKAKPKTETKSSEELAALRQKRIRGESKMGLLPILAFTYPATKPGWRAFYQDALIAHGVGYTLITISPLGTESLGAVWRLEHEQRDEKKYDSFLGDEDDGVLGFDDEHVILRDA